MFLRLAIPGGAAGGDRHALTEIIAELLSDAHRPHRASRAQELIGELGVAFLCQCVMRELRAQSALEVLPAAVRVTPFMTAVHEGIAKRDEAVYIPERGPAFVKGLGIGNHKRELVFVEDGWPRHVRPEVRRHGQHAPSVLRIAVDDMILDLQVQLVDRRFEERSRGKQRANHVRSMATDDFGVRRANVLLLELAGQVGQVSRREEMMAIQRRRNLLDSAVYRFRRNVDFGFAV